MSAWIQTRSCLMFMLEIANRTHFVQKLRLFFTVSADMSSNEVKILGTWSSPFVMRAKIALNIKGVEYESIEQNLFSKGDLLLKSNPVYGQVPVLIHGDRPVCESLMIIRYIDEVWASGPGILSSDPYDRATANFWAAYIDNTWFPNLKELILAEGDEAKITSRYLRLSEGLVLLEEVFRKCRKDQKFFGGDIIGYLDIALGSLLGWMKAAKLMADVTLIDEFKTPNLFKWAQNFCAEGVVKDVMPETFKLAEYGNFLAVKFKEYEMN